VNECKPMHDKAEYRRDIEPGWLSGSDRPTWGEYMNE